MIKIHPAANHRLDQLNNIRKEIIDEIVNILKEAGGRICLRLYHEYEDLERNAFFDIGDDGYGYELFIEDVYLTPDGSIELRLTDSEQSRDVTWNSIDLNTSSAYYLLSELEAAYDIAYRRGYVMAEYDDYFDPDADNRLHQDYNKEDIEIGAETYWLDEAGKDEKGRMIHFTVVEYNGEGYFNLSTGEDDKTPSRWAFHSELELIKE